jgi:hypothetical protein
MTEGCATVPVVTDLRAWILEEHASAHARIEQGILAHVPVDRWRDRPAGSSCVAWLLFHLTYHADLALSTVVGGEAPLLAGHRARLGLGADPHVGLGERDVRTASDALDPDALVAYWRAVRDANDARLRALDLAVLDEPSEARDRVISFAGLDPGEVPWLFGMWDGKPLRFFVQWEALGHVLNHVGELTGLRAMLGCSPF